MTEAAAVNPPHFDVIVYSAPDCSQCSATKIWLKTHDIPYTEVASEAAQFLKDEGFSSLPVVVVGERRWAGFRIDKLKTLLR